MASVILQEQAVKAKPRGAALAFISHGTFPGLLFAYRHGSRTRSKQVRTGSSQGLSAARSRSPRAAVSARLQGSGGAAAARRSGNGAAVGGRGGLGGVRGVPAVRAGPGPARASRGEGSSGKRGWIAPKVMPPVYFRLFTTERAQ